MEAPQIEKNNFDNEEDEEADEEEEDEEGASTNGDKDEDEKTQLEGAYDPSKYESLQVPAEIKNLFSFITFYTPQMIEISSKLKPFIPDYIPAVGDVDAFIKIPYPDKTIENRLGLAVLDEPSINQSDAALLQLKLKAVSKEIDSSKDSSLRETVVQSSGTAQEIDTWIENIKHLHETTARPDSVTMMSTHHKPDIEELMQEWHNELENALTVHSIPNPELDCSLDEYINILCAILDIPVQSNKIASLHLMFSLYNEFKSSQHFKKLNN
ncbi:Intraflagellar transport protein 46 [Tyrophagus putrescentiae]|nr:Intraflagellar transport protein 46 [Tyrophagus putrescentiae]